MTKIEQLQADLETIQEAAGIAKRQGFPERSGNYDQVESELKQEIADLEAQQATKDVWAEIKEYWEGVDGGKVRDDRKAILAEKNRENLAELTTIANAIPPACGLARELVEKRIEGVKREMQA